MINETLYTSESGASLAKFKEEPDLFDVVRLASFFVCYVVFFLFLLMRL